MGIRSSYVLVTPATDEAGLLDDLVVTIRTQERRPDLWVIVDGGSSDDTAHRVRRLGQRDPWIHGITMPASSGAAPRGRAELVVAGFRYATEQAEADGLAPRYLVNLDPDLRCAPHLLAQLIDRCDGDRNVGIGSCMVADVTDDGRVSRHRDVVDGIPRGELRVWRRACAEEVGMQVVARWAESTGLRARNRGWRTPVFADLSVEAARPGVVRGAWNGFGTRGAEGWEVGLHPLLMAGEAVTASARDRDLRGVAMLAGYVKAAISGQRRSHDPELREYFGEDRLKQETRRLLSRVPLVGRRFRRSR